jgi:hypothetical protein
LSFWEEQDATDTTRLMSNRCVKSAWWPSVFFMVTLLYT